MPEAALARCTLLTGAPIRARMDRIAFTQQASCGDPLCGGLRAARDLEGASNARSAAAIAIYAFVRWVGVSYRMARRRRVLSLLGRRFDAHACT